MDWKLADEMGTERMLREQHQECYIHCAGGFENLLVKVDLDTQAVSKAVWVFPIPSRPESASINIVEHLPSYFGSSAHVRALEALSEGLSIMILSQFNPIAILLSGGIGHEDKLEPNLGFDIYQHVEKLGLTTELVSVRDSVALTAYFRDRGLKPPAEAERVIRDYVGREFSFVVSWVSQPLPVRTDSTGRLSEKRLARRVAVAVRFPTRRPFFPLKPTSAYGDDTIPIVVRVDGWVTPELYAELAPMTEVRYIVDGQYEADNDLAFFFDGRVGRQSLDYTEVLIRGPASRLTRDLYFRNSVPARPARSRWLTRFWWLVDLVIFLAGSYLAGLLAGLVAFRKNRLPTGTLAAFGLLNCLTLIGVVVGVLLWKPRGPDPDPSSVNGHHAPAIRRMERFAFIVLFTFFFQLFAMLSHWALLSLT
jgi:hypothetical protein